MNTPITNRTLREIKALAKQKRKADKNLTYCQHLDSVAREIAGVADFHQAITLTNKSIKHSERLDPLEGLSSAQREEYYYRMASILDREVLEIYPESNQYLSDSDFDYDDY